MLLPDYSRRILGDKEQDFEARAIMKLVSITERRLQHPWKT